MEFLKLNDEPIEIEILYDEDGFSYLGFEFEGSLYDLNCFLRTHSNPWVSDCYPEYIHGVEMDNMFDPLYVEILDNAEEVNVYAKI